MKQPFLKRLAFAVLSLLLAAIAYLPLTHVLFRDHLRDYFQRDEIPPKAALLAARQLDLWEDPGRRAAEVAKMRATNAEWDFMGRNFFCWSLANMALREPENSDRYLGVIDRIIEETIRLEREEGHLYFLMNYAQGRDFEIQPNRSLFIDGEIALVMGMRRLVEEKEEYIEPMRERIDHMVERMESSPVLCGESYPSECWMFCNSVALAAIKLGDILDGADHSDFIDRWMQSIKQNLIDEKTGLLVSSFLPDGAFLDGPEGSSIWMAAHCLQIVDSEFAEDQYRRARKRLGVDILGFSYAKEWPATWPNKMDVDSGPIVPLLEASAGSSGQAFLAAATFEDTDFLKGLLASLNLAAFPIETEKSLKYCAGNQVGDAVLLYAMTSGPVWRKAMDIQGRKVAAGASEVMR